MIADILKFHVISYIYADCSVSSRFRSFISFFFFFSLLLIDLSVACKAVEVSYSFGLVLQLLRIRNEIDLRKESRYTYTNGQFNYIIIHSFISSLVSFFLPSFFHQSIHSLICLLMNQSPPRYIKELKGKA